MWTCAFNAAAPERLFAAHPAVAIHLVTLMVERLLRSGRGKWPRNPRKAENRVSSRVAPNASGCANHLTSSPFFLYFVAILLSGSGEELR